MFTIQFYPLGIRALLQMIMRHISNTNKYSLVMKDILSKVSTQDNWFSWAFEFYDLFPILKYVVMEILNPKTFQGIQTI